MTMTLRKVAPASLRSLGLDERWLQDQIYADPSLLNLGDLVVVRRERVQPSAGRLDFLMRDPEDETRYEIELMLGATNESHIIRSIEYWDLERQRYPTYEHRAVIVAEEITARFFNVIRLLNRSVPMIAIQVNALPLDDNSVALHFAKVLDVFEAIEDAEDTAVDQADRRYWEKRASPESIAAADELIALIPGDRVPPRITYNQTHIAIGTAGRNFCWLIPRKSARCHVSLRSGSEQRSDVIKRLEDGGIPARARGQHSIALGLNQQQIQSHAALLRDVLQLCEKRAQDSTDTGDDEA